MTRSLSEKDEIIKSLTTELNNRADELKFKEQQIQLDAQQITELKEQFRIEL